MIFVILMMGMIPAPPPRAYPALSLRERDGFLGVAREGWLICDIGGKEERGMGVESQF